MGVNKYVAFGLLGVLLYSNVSLGGTGRLSLEDKMSIARTRCAPRAETEPVLYRNDVGTDHMQSIEEMAVIYTGVYNSERRLPHRAGLDPNTQAYISTNGKDYVIFPEHFLKTVTLHIENALKLKYADFIFFPDMGHAHFFIPDEYYNNRLTHTEPPFYNSLNKVLSDNPKGLKSLYHTAEHLKTHTDRERTTLVDDRHTQWRFYTRNPVFDAHGNSEVITNFEESGANTAREYAEHRFTAGFNISANKNGCFPFEDAHGEIQYFDISAWDLASDCSRSDCNGGY